MGSNVSGGAGAGWDLFAGRVRCSVAVGAAAAFFRLGSGALLARVR